MLNIEPKPRDLLGYIEMYLSDCQAQNLAEATLRLYEIVLKRFINFTGNYDIASIDNRTLMRFLFDMQQSPNISARSAAHYFGIVRTFFTYLWKTNEIPINPGAVTKPPKPELKLPKVLDEYKAQIILDHVPITGWEGQRNKTAIFLLLGTGVRIGELRKLNVDDVNLTLNELHIRGKGAKERLTPFTEEVADVIRTWLDLRRRVLRGKDISPLFFSQQLKRLSSGYGTTIKNLCHDAGVECTAHTFRHTCATDLVRSGVDLKTVQQYLGHTNIATTEKYVHIAQNELRRAVNNHSLAKRLRFDGPQMDLGLDR